LTISAGNGITVSNVSVTGVTSATATFTVASSAALGARDVAMTASGGTSNAVTFTVVPPFPDLSIVETHSGNAVAGFNDTLQVSIGVSNVGTADANNPITVSDVLPAGLTFVSGTGSGWTCGASGQAVTCATPGPLAVGAQSAAITLTLSVSLAAAPGVTNRPAVTTAGDLNPANDIGRDPITIIRAPTPVFVFSTSSPQPGLQASLKLTLPTAFPFAFSGTITMGFVSNAVIPVDDPAIQFATGGRQVAFTFDANALQAQFSGSPDVGFQTGTVAGTLTFSGTLQAGTVQASFAPSLSAAPLIVMPLPPKISRVQKDTSGKAVLIDLYSTTREVTQLSFEFITSQDVKLSCGSAPGCSVSGSSMTFDVHSIFDAWYSGDVVFGSLSRLRVPFSIDGTVTGTVNLKLANSKGPSNGGAFSLP
jgi:uncharacterized repeat protein (TIGR01451 family)